MAREQVDLESDLKAHVLPKREEFFQYLASRGLYYCDQRETFLGHMNEPAIERLLIREYGKDFIKRTER